MGGFRRFLKWGGWGRDCLLMCTEMVSSIVMYNFGVGHGGPYKSANLEGHQSNLLLWGSGWSWDVGEARTDTKVIHYYTTTSLILSLVGNFKLPEQATNFSQIQVKMNKLCHQIEDKLSIDLESCKIEDIRLFISEYDNLYEQLDYSFPNFIKNRVKSVYSGKKVLILLRLLSFPLRPCPWRTNLGRSMGRSTLMRVLVVDAGQRTRNSKHSWST